MKLSGSSTTRCTTAIGSASIAPEVDTSMVGTIDSSIGSRIANLVPCPSDDSMWIAPRFFSTAVFTTSMPTPRPETEDATSLVEKPGKNTSW